MTMNLYQENQSEQIDQHQLENEATGSRGARNSTYSSFAGSADDLLERDKYGNGQNLAFRPQSPFGNQR